MAAGEPPGTGDPFEQHIDFDESMERVKDEGPGLLDRFLALLTRPFR